MVSFNIDGLSLEDVIEMVLSERRTGRRPKKWMRKLLDAKIRERGLKSGDKIPDDGRYTVYRSSKGLLNIRRTKRGTK